MSPTNFGLLLPDQVAPTGLVTIKRGVTHQQIAVPAANVTLQDGAGGPMQIQITPSRPGWWLIRAENIFITSANWMYFAWYVALSPADADGRSAEWNHGCQHSAQAWQQQCLDTAFRLNAGIAYTADMRWGYTQGEAQYYYSGPNYQFIAGEFVGEGQP